MHKPLLALPISQHFKVVFPKLKDIIKVLVVRDFKLVPRNSLFSQYRMVYHTNGFVNIQFAERINDQFFDNLRSYGIDYMSFDFGPSCLDVTFNPARDDGFYRPNKGSVVLGRDDIISIAQERIKAIKRRFQGDLAIENLEYHPGGAYEHVCEPVFIAEAVEKLGIYLVVDIGHIFVTAVNLGIDPAEYLSHLPLERIREIHLSHSENGVDLHGCPTDIEYCFLLRLLSKSRPDFIVIEHYSDPAKIIDEYIKLNQFLEKN